MHCNLKDYSAAPLRPRICYFMINNVLKQPSVNLSRKIICTGDQKQKG